MANNLKECLENILVLGGDRLPSAEIANIILNDQKYNPFRQKKIDQAAAKTPADSPLTQISAEIACNVGENGTIGYSIFGRDKDATTNKFLYFRKATSTIMQTSTAIPSTISNKVLFDLNAAKESDLYPITKQWLDDENNIAKRIREGTTSNRKGVSNEWLHPDIVCVTWDKTSIQLQNNSVKNLYSKMNSNLISFSSYEVKKELTVNNCRSSFFQTVANSQWANNAWLVAASIDDAANNELRYLCSQYNIGLAILDCDNPKNTQQRYMPKQSDAKWLAIDRLAEVNLDFKVFMRKVSNFMNDPNTANFKDIDK